MLSINSAKYSGKYNLQLVFSNGKEGIANLEEMVFKDNRTIFNRLKDISTFRNFKVEHSTVVWFGELDLAPEYLFYLAFKDDNTLQGQFREWGYTTT
jgi:hypothetical protein